MIIPHVIHAEFLFLEDMADKFLQMISTLRQQEEVMLYGNLLATDAGEEAAVAAFLKGEYVAEADNYPHEVPAFNEAAALWAARTIYISAQLMLYRQNKGADLPALLPAYTGEMDAAAILSADLCLRFLPQMQMQLCAIDREDPLIAVLEHFLTQWHYSAVGYSLDSTELNIKAVEQSQCLRQLYANRITENKSMALARHPVFNDLIAGNIGLFEKEFWNDFKINN